MNRAKQSLAIISLDLKNARARQRTRITSYNAYSLAIGNSLIEIAHHVRRLRKEINRVERLEARERSAKRDRNPISKLQGINRRMTGTYGRP